MYSCASYWSWSVSVCACLCVRDTYCHGYDDVVSRTVQNNTSKGILFLKLLHIHVWGQKTIMTCDVLWFLPISVYMCVCVHVLMHVSRAWSHLSSVQKWWSYFCSHSHTRMPNYYMLHWIIVCVKNWFYIITLKGKKITIKVIIMLLLVFGKYNNNTKYCSKLDSLLSNLLARSYIITLLLDYYNICVRGPPSFTHITIKL